MRMISVRRSFILICTVGCVTLIADLTGVHRHLFEKQYETEFSYPLDVNDFKTLVLRYRNHDPVSHEPINEAGSEINYLSKGDKDCSQSFRLLILVKSDPKNFERRAVIRKTWGYQKRFSDVPIKTVFLLGLEEDEGENREENNAKLQDEIKDENLKFGDIAQGNFPDSESNSTVKTLMGLRWMLELCPDFRFSIIINDDMYLSVKNLLKFVRHPAEYPIYWERQKELDIIRRQKNFKKRVARSVIDRHVEGPQDTAQVPAPDHANSNVDTRKKPLPKPIKNRKNHPVDFDIDLSEDTILYAGHVTHEKTQRHKIGSNYFLALEEYPYDKLPPLVSPEAIVLSKPAVTELYYSSFYTKYLRHDGIFLGVCAKKMDIEPFHSEHFQLDRSLVHDPYGQKDFRYVITANNFDNSEGLETFWNIQKGLGNA